jgi:hypothetical protein
MTEVEQLEGFLEWDAEELESLDKWVGAWDFVKDTLSEWERPGSDVDKGISFFTVIQRARDIRTHGEVVSEDLDKAVGMAMYHEAAQERVPIDRAAAASLIKGAWEYLHAYGVDEFYDLINALMWDQYQDLRRASDYYLSLSPDAIVQVFNVAYNLEHGVITPNEAAEAVREIARSEGKSPRAAYFNVYYLAKATGDPTLTSLARALSRR